MTTTRKRYSAKFKARVALEAIRGEKTLAQLGTQFQVHPVQIAQWRKAALEQLEESMTENFLSRLRKSNSHSLGIKVSAQRCPYFLRTSMIEYRCLRRNSL